MGAQQNRQFFFFKGEFWCGQSSRPHHMRDALRCCDDRCHIAMLGGSDVEPVVSRAGQQDEMDHRGQQEQEHALCHKDAARIENQPDFVEFDQFFFPLRTTDAR